MDLYINLEPATHTAFNVPFDPQTHEPCPYQNIKFLHKYNGVQEPSREVTEENQMGRALTQHCVCCSVPPAWIALLLLGK